MRSITMATAVLLATVSFAETTPDPVHYQGVLRDASDQPLTGSYDMVFRFFGAETAGNELLVDRHLAAGTGAVPVQGGLFGVALGGGAVSDGAGPGVYTSLSKVFLDDATVWLEIEVQGQTLAPRVRLLATPYAHNASNLAGQPPSAFLDTSAASQAKLGSLAIGGTLAIAGGGPGAGRVLTSDASGLASWQEPPVTAKDAALRELADRLRTVDPATLPFGELGRFNCGSTPATLTFSIDGTATGSVAGFVGVDRIASPFEYLIELDSAVAIDPEAQIGKLGRLTVSRASGSTTFSGRITEFGLAGLAAGTRTYVVRLEPALSDLKRRSDYEVFQGLTIPQVVDQVLVGAGVTLRSFALGAHSPIDMTVQYDESDLQFIQRLVENEGIHYHFRENAAGDEVVFGDANTAFAAAGTYAYRGDLVDPGTGEEYLRTFHARSRRYTATGRVRAYSITAPSTPVDQSFSAGGGVGEQYEFYSEDVNAARAAARAQQIVERDQVRRFERSGSSNAPDLRAGRTMTVTDATGAGFGGSYAVTDVVHFALRDPDPSCIGYGNVFTAIPGSVKFRPERLTPKPVVRGTAIGQVTGPAGSTEHVDSFGRVKVKFAWDRSAGADENSSGWIRLAVPAGRVTERRWVPQVGDEVIVAFLDGDPDRPVVVGSLYNASHLPPAVDSMTLGGDLTVEGNDIVFGGGGRLVGSSTTALQTLGEADTDSLLLFAGNSLDDGAIRVFGDGNLELRSGNGVVAFMNGATAAETGRIDGSGNLQLSGGLRHATGSFTFTALDTGFSAFLDQTSATLNEWKIGGANLDLFLGDSLADNVLIPGDLTVTGVKNFVQNHPQRKDLSVVYTALEGDEAGTYTRGSARLKDGVARVTLGETFAWVTNPDVGLTAQVTPRGDWADLYVESVTTRELIVRSRAGGDARASFDYLVHGLRIGYEEYGVVQPRRMDGSIPVRVAAATTDSQSLRSLDALTRFREMESRSGRKAAEHPAADALRAAIGERPETDGAAAAPAGLARLDPGGSAPEVAGARDRTNPAEPVGDDAHPTGDPGTAPGLSAKVCVRGFEPGELVAVDRDDPSRIVPALRAADTAVVGFATHDPLAPCEAGHGTIAFAGIVTAKVDASYGAIEIGDLLTSSPSPGHAMRAAAPVPGTIVGKALEPLPSGKGTIRVLVTAR